MLKLVIVGTGGFIGAIARYGLSGFVHRYFSGWFPIGTFLVNVLGCLVLGAAMSLVENRQLLSPDARSFLFIGVLGSFTTFSTLGYETFELIKSGDMRLAFGNIAANIVIGLGAVAFGWFAVKATGV